MLAAFLVLLPSCQQCRGLTEVDDVNTLDTTLPPGTTNGSQEPPGPVLASIWIPDSIHPRRFKPQPYAQRILADGSVWYYQDERDRIVPGEPPITRDPVELAWWFEGERVTPRDIRILSDAVRMLGLMDLPTEPPPPTETLIGTSEVLWTFSIDGRPSHDVRAYHGQPRLGIERFNDLFNHAFHNAQMRWMRDRGVTIEMGLDPLPEP